MHLDYVGAWSGSVYLNLLAKSRSASTVSEGGQNANNIKQSYMLRLNGVANVGVARSRTYYFSFSLFRKRRTYPNSTKCFYLDSCYLSVYIIFLLNLLNFCTLDCASVKLKNARESFNSSFIKNLTNLSTKNLSEDNQTHAFICYNSYSVGLFAIIVTQ